MAEHFYDISAAVKHYRAELATDKVDALLADREASFRFPQRDRLALGDELDYGTVASGGIGGVPMAEALRFVCDGCGRSIEAWSDGNPYYINEAGAKQYAYHADHERLARCIGSDSPHLCLGCGAEFVVDSRAPVEECPTCGSAEFAHTFQLAGRRCPYCKAGTFAVDPGFHCVS
jgi:predicted RNA-binding Zn-ribbon protein involved in translation (DUF1610 family)